MNYIIAAGAYSVDRYNIHEHNDYEIIFYSSGQGKIKIGENEYNIGKGNIVIVPPKTKHGSISFDNLQYISVLGNKGGWIHIDMPIICTDNEKSEGLCLVQMILSNRYNKDDDFLDALCFAYVLFVLKNVQVKGEIEKAVAKIRNQININFHDRAFNVTEILRDSGYAEDYIRLYFKKTVGKSPIEFLNETRINNAKVLIGLYKNSMSLYELAIHCGFDDYVYFSRKFKSITGLSPQKYKKFITE